MHVLQEPALIAAIALVCVAGLWLAYRAARRWRDSRHGGNTGGTAPLVQMHLKLFSQEDAQEFFEMYRDSGRTNMQDMGSEMLAVYAAFCKHRKAGRVMIMRDLNKPDAADEILLFHMEDEPSPVKSNVVPFRPRGATTRTRH